MSFICEKCNTAQPNGIKPNRVVAATREKEYVNKDTGKVSYGWEIVHEMNLCGECEPTEEILRV